MPVTISAKLDAAAHRFAVVAARFNDFIVGKLVEGALDTLVRHGAAPDGITQVWAPGSFELPLIAHRLAASGRFAAVICVGCVIRGQTPHFEYVAGEAAKGIAQAALATGVPVAFGVVTADTLEQAIDRAGGKHGNKGAEAALTAIEMANLMGLLPKA
jgi:6,7-dimethyl-8-ribityllumazine synthase